MRNNIATKTPREHVLEIEATLKILIWFHIKKTFTSSKFGNKEMVLGFGLRACKINMPKYRLDYELDGRIRKILRLRKLDRCAVSGKLRMGLSKAGSDIETIRGQLDWIENLGSPPPGGLIYLHKRLKLKLSSGARARLLKKNKKEVLEEVLKEMIVKLEAFGSGLRLEALRP